jgi:hypothetical protein
MMINIFILFVVVLILVIGLRMTGIIENVNVGTNKPLFFSLIAICIFFSIFTILVTR